MTASLLLAVLSGAILIQLAVAICISALSRRGVATEAPIADIDAAKPSTGAWPGWREFRVARRVFEDARRTQCSFYLEPVDGAPLPAFQPGQFLTFKLPVAAAHRPDGQGSITRCYSLSDRPDEARYRVTIKRVPAPREQPQAPPGASSNHFHDRIGVGDVVLVKAPAGRFILDPHADVPAVLIAGGIGITPMMSMLRWSLEEQPQRPLLLYYGVRNGGEQAFKEQLSALAAAHPNLHLEIAYSRPGEGDVAGRDYRHLGHVDIDLLRRTLPHGRHQFYACGPPPMMQSLTAALRDWGVPAADIHYEAFGPASVNREPVAPPAGRADQALACEVRFRRSGRTLTWDGADANLLDFAERHGVTVESGCRSGGCGSCETRLISGTVGYEHTPDHDVAPGHCLLCVGAPQSPLVLEA